MARRLSLFLAAAVFLLACGRGLPPSDDEVVSPDTGAPGDIPGKSDEPAPVGEPPANGGADRTPPVFAGLKSLTATVERMDLSWEEATDDVTPGSDLVYDVYGSAGNSVEFDEPLLSTARGATSISIAGLPPGATWSFGVRARDAAGNRDANTVVRTATAPRVESSPSAAGPAPSPAPDPEPEPEAPPVAETEPSPFEAMEDEVLRLVNGHRAQGAVCGSSAYPPARALVMNANLRAAARGHSEDMADRNYFSHTTPDGTTFSQRIRAAGYAGSPIAENIAVGYATAQAVVDGWMRSEGHCRNIMNGAYRSIGVGVAASSRTYWTQNFGGL